MTTDDAAFRRAVHDAVAEALAKARLMPTPGHVTEVVFRMGAPDAIQALGRDVGAEASCRPPVSALLAGLPLTEEDKGLMQQLTRKLGGSEEQLLTTLLLRLIQRELRGYASE
jgi:hypothetical protein